MASAKSVAEARQKILEALASCDSLNITVPPLILAFWAGYLSTDGKAYRKAFKDLKDTQIIVASKDHVELTERGKSMAPKVKPPSDDSMVHKQLFWLD